MKNAWLAALLTLASAVLSLLALGPGVVGAVVAMIAGFFLYLRTFHRRMPAPETILPVYRGIGSLVWGILILRRLRHPIGAS